MPPAACRCRQPRGCPKRPDAHCCQVVGVVPKRGSTKVGIQPLTLTDPLLLVADLLWSCCFFRSFVFNIVLSLVLSFYVAVLGTFVIRQSTRSCYKLKIALEGCEPNAMWRVVRHGSAKCLSKARKSWSTANEVFTWQPAYRRQL